MAGHPDTPVAEGSYEPLKVSCSFSADHAVASVSSATDDL